MKKLIASVLALWQQASPTKRRWIIMGGGVLVGILLVWLL